SEPEARPEPVTVQAAFQTAELPEVEQYNQFEAPLPEPPAYAETPAISEPVPTEPPRAAYTAPLSSRANPLPFADDLAVPCIQHYLPFLRGTAPAEPLPAELATLAE